jgi:hypothetical protein
MTASVNDRASSPLGGPLDATEDAFFRDLRALNEGEDDAESVVADAEVMTHGLVQLSEALGSDAVATPPGARERLLADIPANGRFARFAEATAKLLDIGLERAKVLLDRLADDSVFSQELPGISFYWCEGGPAVANAVRGFVRVAAGTHFPEHEHIGDEIVLVLQGSFVDTTRGLAFAAGDSDVMKAGTSHAYYVPEGGPDLLKLSVTQEGLRALGQTFLPRA